YGSRLVLYFYFGQYRIILSAAPAAAALRIMRYCRRYFCFYYIIVPAKMKHLTPDEQTYLRFV
ncbi:MAG: hypothetical protein WAW66_07455, partial [Gemmiger qucibialis]